MTIKCVFMVCVALNIVWMCQADIGFGFPEASHEDKSKQNIDNKKPVYVPARCDQDELLYPGDQLDDWVCDCKPAFLFYPLMNRCYAAYRKGPCDQGKYLILPKDKVIPECVTNPCRTDGLVRFRNACHALDQAGPCHLPELATVVGVNETTLAIDCLSPKFESRFGEDENEKIEKTPKFDRKACFSGGKRSLEGRCADI